MEKKTIKVTKDFFKDLKWEIDYHQEKVDSLKEKLVVLTENEKSYNKQ